MRHVLPNLGHFLLLPQFLYKRVFHEEPSSSQKREIYVARISGVGLDERHFPLLAVALDASVADLSGFSD